MGVLRDRFYIFAFKLFGVLINIFGDRILYFLAFMGYKFFTKQTKIIFANLDLAYGDSMALEEKNKIAKENWKNLVFYLASFVQNQNATKTDILNKVTFENSFFLENAIKNRQRVVLISAHYGNWELLSLALPARFGEMAIVGRSLETQKLNDILKQTRERFGVEIIDKKGALKGLIEAISKNKIIGLFVDQNTSSSEGLVVDFFQKEARHTPSAALLARKFDLLIVPVFITSFDRKNYIIKFYEPFKCPKTENREQDILECVQMQAAVTQSVIQKKPDEYFWFHKRWKNRYEEAYK